MSTGLHPPNNDLHRTTFDDIKGLTRERPWLLPSNRKLRHLQGISLRNLNVSLPDGQRRGKTADDESLPSSFNTPTKLLAQRESRKLHHSSSSVDLKHTGKQNGIPQENRGLGAKGSQQQRPPIGRLRRSSTLNWVNAPPSTRQKRLEDVTGERMADTWFSIHCSGIESPVYISEVIKKVMNPNYAFFDLNIYGPFITRREDLLIKFWAKTDKMEKYILLIQVELSLSSLQFIGKSLETFYHPLPRNCILFHLTDGIYTSFTDLPLEQPFLSTQRRPSQQKAPATQPTSSFDALMKLSNLDDCIQDAFSTRDKLSAQIESLYISNKDSLHTINDASHSNLNLSRTKSYIAIQRTTNTQTASQLSTLRASLDARRTGIAAGYSAQSRASKALEDTAPEMASTKAAHAESEFLIRAHIRRICTDLSFIFPILPVHGQPLNFTILSLHLPNATSPKSFPATSASTTAAALGLVAHLLHNLSLYLSVHLPYPITPHGSTSTILDPISSTLHSKSQKHFPLFQKGQLEYRFEYGLFLLNKDLEILMGKWGLRAVDLRFTLANLKALVEGLASGEGEVVGRKGGRLGGVGGLEGGGLEVGDGGEESVKGKRKEEAADEEELELELDAPVMTLKTGAFRGV